GTFDCISILPPRCIRNVRSLTLWILTDSICSSAAAIASACWVSRVAIVTSMRSVSWPAVLTSRAVTTPPAFSTTWVIWLTALPPAGTSSRTVMEYDTLGTLATATAPSVRVPHVPRASLRSGAAGRDGASGGRGPARARGSHLPGRDDGRSTGRAMAGGDGRAPAARGRCGHPPGAGTRRRGRGPAGPAPEEGSEG